MFELVAATACWPPIIWWMLTYETKPISAKSMSAAPVPMESFCTHVNCIDTPRT